MVFELPRLLTAIFLHSLYIISMQVVLMRVLSIMQWDTFANLTISIAMLGFGVSGTLLSIFRHSFYKHSFWLIPTLILLTALFINISFFISQSNFVSFDSLLIFQSFSQMLKFLVFVLLFFIPFFLGSLALGLIFTTNLNHIHQLYFINLLGSGLGGLLALLLLNFMPPNQALIFLSFFPCVAALVLYPIKKQVYIFLVTLVVFLFSVFHLIFPTNIHISQYKSLSKAMMLPDAKKVFEYNSLTSQISIVQSDYLYYSTSLSLQQSYLLPSMLFVFRNGNYVGVLPKKEEDIEILNHSTLKLAHDLTSPQTVAIMHSGTGFYAKYSVFQGANKVYAVEPDLGIIDAIKKWSKQNNRKLFDFSNIQIVPTNPRFFLDSTQQKFDLIVLPAIGYQNVSASQTAIIEEYDLTLEAFMKYWEKLSNKGILYINCFFDNPPRSSLKTLNTIVKMLQNAQVNLNEHVISIRNWNSISFFIKKIGFDEEQQEKIKRFSDEKGFDILLHPQIHKLNRQKFHFLTDTTLFTLFDRIVLKDLHEPFHKYVFKITPAIDNKPYFSNYLSIRNLPQLLDEYTFRDLYFVEASYFLLWLSFFLLIILSIIFILLPLLQFVRTSGNVGILFYFGSIGLAFMMFEILLIQRFIYYLGNAIYSTTAVLTIMLVFSGLGSYYSNKLSRKWSMLFPALVLYILTLTFIYDILINNTLSYPLFLKLLLMIIIIGIPSFFMGMPFPMGMKYYSEKFSDKIPWAWGINGFMSVCAIPLATLLTIEIGAKWLFFLSAFLYIIPFFVLILCKKT